MQRGYVQRTLMLLIAFGCVLFPLAGCGMNQNTSGSGTIVEKVYPASEFDSIELSGIGKLELVQGDSDSVVVSADDNIQPLILVETTEGHLKLGLKPNGNIGNATIVYKVKARVVHEVKLSGAAAAEVSGLNTEDINFILSGAGSINVKDLSAEDINVKLSGTGNATVAGQADQLVLDISGAGSFKGAALDLINARISVSGAGSADVTISDALDAKVSGAGSVTYGSKGDPQVTQSVSGAGSVKKR